MDNNSRFHLDGQLIELRDIASILIPKLDKDHGKLIKGMLDALEKIETEIKHLKESNMELNEYIDAIDDDLAEIESVVFDDDYDDIDEEQADDDPVSDGSGIDQTDDQILYNCPHCDYEITYQLSDLRFNREAVCPNCGKLAFPDCPGD